MRLPILTGTNVRLRPLKRSDISKIAEGANDRTISKFIPSIPYPYSIDNARKWVNRVQRSARKDTAYQFGIEPLGSDGIIGMMGLNNLNWTDRNAEIEAWLAKSYRGRAFASEALGLILHLCFGELQMHRIYGVMVCLNERSIRLVEKHGFTREAIWRKACWMDGGWHDVYAYGMLEEEAAAYT